MIEKYGERWRAAATELEVSGGSRPGSMRSHPPAALPWLTAAILGAGLAVLAWHAHQYFSFIEDDALISLRYAQRLIEGHGLTWTDGERVEGYSNLLWVLACAALGWVGVDLIDAARILGFAGMGSAVVAAVVAHPPAESGGALPALGAALALALSGPIAAWSVAGLEQPLVAGLLAWALVLARPLVEDEAPSRTLAPAVPLALLCLTRPDGFLFTAAVGAAIVLARGASRSSIGAALRLAVLPGLLVSGQLVFRRLYYADWVANPARVKLAFSTARLESGVWYVASGALWLLGLTLLASLSLLPALVDRRYRRRVLLLLAPIICWTAYVAAIGGDIFPARRHLVPVVVMAALLSGGGLAWVVGRGGRARAAAWAGTAGLLVLLGVLQAKDEENLHAKEERWEWAGQVIGGLLKQAFGPQRPLLAVNIGGSLPYFSGLPSLDMLGLTDRYLPRHRPPSFGRGYLGHELGDGKYVMSRKPDLVVLCGPAGGERGCFRGDVELLAMPRFREQYMPVTFEGREPYTFRSRIWVRTDGGRVGIERNEGAVRVPGFLLAADPSTPAHLDGQGRLGVTATEKAPARLRQLSLHAGAWRVDAEFSGAPPRVRVEQDGKPLGQGIGTTSFTVSGSVPIGLEVATAAGGASHVRRLVLSILPEAGAPINRETGTPVEEELFRFLKTRGLTRSYVTEDWLASLTAEAGEEIIFAQPVGDRYRHLVDGASRVGYLFPYRQSGQFTALLRGIGATFERTVVGSYEIFHDFRPPRDAEALRSLSGSRWRATASSTGTPPALAFDRDIDTSWYSGEPQRPGLFFQVDLGQPTQVGKVVLLSPRPSIGGPRGYRVELSRDGRRWEETAAVADAPWSLDWAKGQPRMGPAGRVVSAFEPREVRYLRIHQTGSDPGSWWAIGELFVYGPAPGGSGRPPPEAEVRLKRGEAYEAQGKLTEAVGEYWRATRLDPEMEAAHARLAVLYDRAGIPLDGETSPAVRALAFERLELWAKAAQEYEKEIGRTAHQHTDFLWRRLIRAHREAGARGEAGAEERARLAEERLAREFAPAVPVVATFEDKLRFLGYRVEPDSVTLGQTFHLTYYWQALRPGRTDYTVFVHFVREGKVVFQHDHVPPDRAYPMSEWKEDERVRETFEVIAPGDLEPGRYEIVLGIWDPKTGRRLAVKETSVPHTKDRVVVGSITVEQGS